MYVICNGGMKSGSTWVTQIVRYLKEWDQVPSKYLNPKWKNPSIDKSLLKEFLASNRFKTEDFYTKQHWANEDIFKSLLEYDDIKTINIVRDIRDVVVSRYFHDTRIDATKSEDITEYYWNEGGQNKLVQYLKYQVFWHGNEKEKQPFLLYYEDMLQNHKERILDIAKFLGIDIDGEKLQQIYELTKFDSNSKTGDGEFFRKGVAGDFANHLNDKVMADIYRLANEYDFFTTFPIYEELFSK